MPQYLLSSTAAKSALLTQKGLCSIEAPPPPMQTPQHPTEQNEGALPPPLLPSYELVKNEKTPAIVYSISST